ncbi:MAG: amino acid permease [Vicinamibacterales bacterium]
MPVANRVAVRYAGERGVDTSASAVERAIGSETQRQEALNRYHALLGSWTSVRSASFVNAFSASLSTFLNRTTPTATLPQLTFPSIQDGASFRMPQETHQTRLRFANTTTVVRGPHTMKFGGEFQRIAGEFRLGVFRQGARQLVEDFPAFNRNGDSRVNDDDLLFAVTLRSGKPGQDLVLPDSSSSHVAGFVQDDWTVSNRLTVNLGLRYEVDADINDQSRVSGLNAITPCRSSKATAHADMNNLGPRVGFAFRANDATTECAAATAPTTTGLSCRFSRSSAASTGGHCPIEVRAGNLLFMDPETGRIPPFAPTRCRTRSPASSCRAQGPRASTSSTRSCRTRRCTEFNLGLDRSIGALQVRLDAMHTEGTHFLIGRTVGEVFNPVVGGPDRVVNIESEHPHEVRRAARHAERRFDAGNSIRVGYTLAKALNYANDDQIQFLNGPIDPNDLARVGTGAQRSASSTRRIGADAASGAREPLGPVDAVVRRADGHPDAGWSDAHPDHPAQCGGASVHQCGRAERLHPPYERRGRRRRRAPAARIERRALQRHVQRARSPGVANDRARCARADRADARAVQRLRRHERPRYEQRELLRVLQRADARLRGSLVARLSHIEQLRHAGHDGGRCVRFRRSACHAACGAGDLLSQAIGASAGTSTHRRLGAWAATALVVSETIGVGILLTPATMMRTLGGLWPPIAIWLVMGAVTAAGALCYAELSTRFPRAGGTYVFLSEGFGRRTAFVYGWMAMLVMDPGLTAALGIGFSQYLLAALGLPSTWTAGVAIGGIVAFSVLALRGLDANAHVLRWTASLKFVIVAVLVLAGVWRVLRGAELGAHGPALPGGPSSLAAAIVAAFFAFGGWWESGTHGGGGRVAAAGDADRPDRWCVSRDHRVPDGQRRVAAGGPRRRCRCRTRRSSRRQAVRSSVPVQDVCLRRWWWSLSRAVSWPCCSAITYVFVAMARDGFFLPGRVQWFDEGRGRSVAGTTIQATLAVVLVLLGTFDQILGYFVPAAVFFLGLSAASLFRFERRAPDTGVFRTPWFSRAARALPHADRRHARPLRRRSADADRAWRGSFGIGWLVAVVTGRR